MQHLAGWRRSVSRNLAVVVDEHTLGSPIAWRVWPLSSPHALHNYALEDRAMTSSQPASPTLSRWVAPAALVIALIAIGLAIWALVRSPSEAKAPPSGDAKARVCAAFDTVRKAVSLQTNTDVGRDPVAKEALAANARLATLGGGQYLLSMLDRGTPSELADAVRSFANDLQDVGMNQLAGVSSQDPAQATRMSKAQADSTQIQNKCK